MLCKFSAGWGSSLKLLETQKQLQAKKYVLQNVKVGELCPLECQLQQMAVVDLSIIISNNMAFV